MKRLVIVAVLATVLCGCGNDRTPEAKVDAAIARLGADPATVAQQKVIDGNFGPPDRALNRMIYLVPKQEKSGSDVWIIDSDGEIHDGYYAFLRDNDLAR